MWERSEMGNSTGRPIATYAVAPRAGLYTLAISA
jgi:hypothetical protein